MPGIPEVSPALKARDHKGPSSDGDGDGAPILPVSTKRPNWRCGACGNEWNDAHATREDDRESLSPPECDRCGNEDGNIWIGGGAVSATGDVSHALTAEGFDASEDGTGRGTQAVAFAQNQRGEVRTSDVSPAVTTGGGKPGEGYPAVAQLYSIMPMNSGKDYKARPVDVAQPIMAGGPVGGNQGGDYIATPWAVRRLTPRECERLQGFPDDFTRIPWRGKPAENCPDGPRYKALGNSMAVNVMRWIGTRIQWVEDTWPET